MDFYREFEGIIDLLNHHAIDYAVCGGVAVTFHGYPRFTKDIDLLIPKPELERVTAAVRERGFILDSGRIPFGIGKPEERELFRISKAEGEDLLTLDLLIVGPAYQIAWESRGVFGWKDRQVCVVSLEGLLNMKRLAGRTQDLLDIEKLENADSGTEEEHEEE